MQNVIDVNVIGLLLVFRFYDYLFPFSPYNPSLARWFIPLASPLHQDAKNNAEN